VFKMKIFNYKPKIEDELHYIIRDQESKDIIDTGIVKSNSMAAWGIEMIARRCGNVGTQRFVTSIDAYHDTTWTRKASTNAVSDNELTCDNDAVPFTEGAGTDTYTKVRCAHSSHTAGHASEYFNEITINITLPANSELVFEIKFTCTGVAATGNRQVAHRLGNTSDAIYDLPIDEIGAIWDSTWIYKVSVNSIEGGSNEILVVEHATTFTTNKTYTQVAVHFENTRVYPFEIFTGLSVEVPNGADFFAEARFTFS
jgi:hypothetical protein